MIKVRIYCYSKVLARAQHKAAVILLTEKETRDRHCQAAGPVEVRRAAFVSLKPLKTAT